MVSGNRASRALCAPCVLGSLFAFWYGWGGFGTRVQLQDHVHSRGSDVNDDLPALILCEKF